MDEILASIRKIIAEEPQAKSSGEPAFAALAPQPVHNSNPRLGPAPAKPQQSERPGALLDRIASAVRNAPDAAAETAQGDDALSDIDDLLADAPARPAAAPGAAPLATLPSPPLSAPARPISNLPPLARSEPPFDSIAPAPAPHAAPAAKSPPSAAAPAGSHDALGPLIPLRHDAPPNGTVASRLPPLGGAPLSSDLGPFAAIRPQARAEREEPQLPEPTQPANGRLAASSWPDTLRRAAAAADQPIEPSLPMPVTTPAMGPPSEPVVLAAMPSPAFPPQRSVAPAAAANLFPPLASKPFPAAPSFPPLREEAEADAAPETPAAATGPVVLAAMPAMKQPSVTTANQAAAASPVRAEAVPAPAKPAPSKTLADIARIDELAEAKLRPGLTEPDASPASPEAKPAAAAEAKPVPQPALDPIVADAETSAAAASAFGALAAGLAASSSKSAAVPAAAPKPVAAAEKKEPAAVAPAVQPDIVAGLAAAAAQRPVVAQPHAPAVKPEAPAPEAKVAPPAPSADAVAPAGSPSPPPSEAFLALAQSQPAPATENLPAVIAGGALEPETALDDTVAELLRPMLRQWLADNMPRIVEKALRIELAENLKADQQPNDRH